MYNIFRKRKKKKDTCNEKEKLIIDEFYLTHPEIKEMELIEQRYFYDKTWQFTLSNGECFTVVRNDIESLESFCKTITDLKNSNKTELSKELLCSLDEKDKIYYD